MHARHFENLLITKRKHTAGVTQVNPIEPKLCYSSDRNGGLGALPNYRLYRLDGAGKITSAEWVEAPADEEARVEAVSRCNSGSFELWEKNRLVERFRPERPRA